MANNMVNMADEQKTSKDIAKEVVKEILVKQAEQYSNDEIMRNVQRIENKIDNGFIETHLRLDTTNGKVLTSKTWIDENKEFIKDLKIERKANYKRFIDMAWKIGATLMLSGVGLKWILQALSKM